VHRGDTPRGLRAEATLDPSAPLASCASASGLGRRFLSIYEIGRQLLAQREPARVIRTILDAIVASLGPDHACVLALDRGGSCRALATYHLDLTGPEAAWNLSHTVLRRVRETALAVLAADVRKETDLLDAESVQRFRIRSVICVPLGVAPVRGFVYVDNRGERREFGAEDLEFLTAVSLYASLVLDRAEEQLRTAEALRLSDERLEVLHQELVRHQIVGRSPALLGAYDAVRRLARGGARVLLRGETGTGKELFARAYAAHSGRPLKSYVPVPIPALAASLLESELFGHVRGAFTEATRDKKGRLELADGGVLFLDEIGDVEPALQAKLLRFLDSGEIYRVGDTEARHVDALVVSATNRPIEREVTRGGFRGDLLARLGHVVTIPPLRERPDDVPLLVAHFLGLYCRGGARKAFAPQSLAALARHNWPFNVRELQQVVERAVCLVDGDLVLPEHLPAYLDGPRTSPGLDPGAAPPRPMREAIQELEKSQIRRALEFTQGNKRRAAEILQISTDTFYKRLQEFGLPD
jgi:transcriptional regulator with GAF, ATPase, and Fis domain